MKRAFRFPTVCGAMAISGGWISQSRRTPFHIKLMSHVAAAHGRKFDPTCPACRELKNKMRKSL